MDSIVCNPDYKRPEPGSNNRGNNRSFVDNRSDQSARDCVMQPGTERGETQRRATEDEDEDEVCVGLRRYKVDYRVTELIAKEQEKRG